MAIERRNPLPPGRYWQDILEQHVASFREWLQSNKAVVRVVAAESHPRDGDWPAREWYLFEVSAPTPWQATKWGYPTIATGEVQSSADTVQRPPPEKDPLERIDETIISAGKSATVLLFGGALVLGAVFIYANRIVK